MVREYKFHDDININRIYGDVVKILESMLDNRDHIEKEYKRYKIISEKSHNVRDRDKAASILAKFEPYIVSLLDGTIVDTYRSKVAHLINEYNRLAPRTRVFGMDDCANIPRRVATIRRFFEITSTYVDIKWECTYSMSRICSNCYSHMKKVGPIMRCSSCGHTQMMSNMGDGVEHSKGESTYKPRKNYEKEYRHVCGLSNGSSNDQKIDIESYLYRSGIHEPTRNDVRNAIKACGYSNYNDTNWLYSQITGNPLPPIDSYIDITGDRFELYYRAFSTASKDGKNITNIHFLIRLFLWQENVPYEDEWFSSLSERTLAKHRRNAILVCNILKDEYPDMRWDYPPEWDE